MNKKLFTHTGIIHICIFAILCASSFSKKIVSLLCPSPFNPSIRFLGILWHPFHTQDHVSSIRTYAMFRQQLLIVQPVTRKSRWKLLFRTPHCEGLGSISRQGQGHLNSVHIIRICQFFPWQIEVIPTTKMTSKTHPNSTKFVNLPISGLNLLVSCEALSSFLVGEFQPCLVLLYLITKRNGNVYTCYTFIIYIYIYLENMYLKKKYIYI